MDTVVCQKSMYAPIISIIAATVIYVLLRTFLKSKLPSYVTGLYTSIMVMQGILLAFHVYMCHLHKNPPQHLQHYLKFATAGYSVHMSLLAVAAFIVYRLWRHFRA